MRLRNRRALCQEHWRRIGQGWEAVGMIVKLSPIDRDDYYMAMEQKYQTWYLSKTWMSYQ